MSIDEATPEMWNALKREVQGVGRRRTVRDGERQAQEKKIKEQLIVR
jgi:hypothetical protein